MPSDDDPTTRPLDPFGHPWSDSYTTPAWLTARLPVFDTDPCSNPRSTIRARRAYALERKQDGLKLPWYGHVWLNWPYSDPAPWVEKLLAEVAAGRVTGAVILCKHDTSTAWWAGATSPVFGAPPEQWQFPFRIQFGEPDPLVEARVARARDRGKLTPSAAKSTTNFVSTILHHRGAGGVHPRLSIADTGATCWLRPL